MNRERIRRQNNSANKSEVMTREELEAKLERQLETGEITADEADNEWQDWMHRDEVWNEF